MKIQEKLIEEDGKEKCKNCNWYSHRFFKLNGWEESDWLCGNCFLDELINSEANYQIIIPYDYIYKLKHGMDKKEDEIQGVI